MQTVKVSPKFQVVIPREVRRALKIHPGEKMQMIEYENRIEMIPVRSLKSMRGFLRGIVTAVPREDDRV